MTKTVDEHWDDPAVESQYDKHLMNLEIRRIMINMSCQPGDSVLDVGCGEAEGTIKYAARVDQAVGLDRSKTRLQMAHERIKSSGRNNIELVHGSATAMPFADKSFDTVISQRCMINLLEDSDRIAAAKEIQRVCKDGGTVVLLEGSVEGHNQLNMARKRYGLPPIDVKWHNRFFTTDEMSSLFSTSNGCDLEDVDYGLAGYLYLTRVVKPTIAPDAGWDCEFNEHAARDVYAKEIESCARLRIWVYRKVF